MFSAHKLFKCKKTMKLFKNSFNLAVTTPLLNIYVTWFPGQFLSILQYCDFDMTL